MEKVAVVIPVYKQVLSEKEEASLKRSLTVFKNYEIIIIYPETLDISSYRAIYDTKYWAVSEDWLGTKNGISGYNRMMLSEDFYAMFENYEYILICHIDAWIFRDELLYWCGKGYDCVAAPWIKRKIYERPVIRQINSLMEKYKKLRGKFSRQNLYGKVGNGGLSLRKVSSFRAACRKYHKEIEVFNSNEHHFYNEDVFWALIPREFKYPLMEEAVKFSFDRHPDYCFQLNNKQLPFGCHSWNKSKMYKFWKDIINV